jgi:hypothetical protein
MFERRSIRCEEAALAVHFLALFPTDFGFDSGPATTVTM